VEATYLPHGLIEDPEIEPLALEVAVVEHHVREVHEYSDEEQRLSAHERRKRWEAKDARPQAGR